jgi:hypothetical protein
MKVDQVKRYTKGRSAMHKRKLTIISFIVPVVFFMAAI